MKRFVAALCIAGLIGTNSGCFGSFAATRKLWEFNRDISSEKFIQWLVFLGLVIVPAYALFALGDSLIFNSIEFWGGNNPIGGGPAIDENHRLVRISDDEVLRFTRDPATGAMTVEHLRGGEVVRARRFQPTEDGFIVTDEKGATVASLRRRADGRVEIFDNGEEPLTSVSPEEISRMIDAYKRGGVAALVRERNAGAVAAR